MIVSMIVAVSDNGVIGQRGKIPWKLPKDLRRFKDLTKGKVVIMGRKTYDSLPRKPLPNRLNVVISKRKLSEFPDCLVFDSFKKALETLEKSGHEEVVVIGGESLYLEALELATIAYITRIRVLVSGDAFFPISKIEEEWHMESQTADEPEQSNPESVFEIYTKSKPTPK